MAKNILSLAFFEVSEAGPHYLFRSWAEDTYRHGILLSSQQISTLLERLGGMEEEWERFFSKWIKTQGEIKSIIFNIPSISSYSGLIEYLGWGYKRDGESLPQINLGVVLGCRKGLAR
ncbi:MAG: hypothetical protein ACP5QK_06610 [Myxococcota bacterium]